MKHTILGCSVPSNLKLILRKHPFSLTAFCMHISQIFLILNTLTIFSERHNVWTSSLCNTSSLWIFLSLSSIFLAVIRFSHHCYITTVPCSYFNWFTTEAILATGWTVRVSIPGGSTGFLYQIPYRPPLELTQALPLLTWTLPMVKAAWVWRWPLTPN
jgi:hypothetical protein